jgi:hypothetical protein
VQAASADMSWKAIDRNSQDYADMKKAGIKFYKTPDTVLRAQLAAWDKTVAKKSGPRTRSSRRCWTRSAPSPSAPAVAERLRVDFKMAYNHYFGKKKA